MALNISPQFKDADKKIPLRFWLKSYSPRFDFNHLWRSFLLFNIGLALVYLLINLFISWQWIGQPFAGFLHQNMVITYSNLPGWEIRQSRIGAVPLEDGDVILAVDGVNLPSSQWLMQHVRQQQLGYSVNYTLLKKSGDHVETQFPTVQFTTQNFIQLVAIPAFIAFITLIAVGATAYLRPELLSVQLFTLFSLAVAYFLSSFPEFIISNLFVLNFFLAYLGKITIPPLLLHFLLLFPRPGKVLRNWPFLLPLIYFPILPATIHSIVLFNQPETTPGFNTVINTYSVLYGTVGLALLGYAIFRPDTAQIRKQAAVLFLGLLLPTLLLFGLSWNNASIDYGFIYNILERYGFIGLPIAVAIAIIQYELFGIRRTNRSHLYYIDAIIIVLLGYLFLIFLVSPTEIDLNALYPEDITLIIGTISGFFLVRPLYYWLLNKLRHRVLGDIGDFRVGLRLFSQELVKVKTRRDLELLVSWQISSNFRLRNAELVSGERPTIPYALQLPLAVSNIFLGTLFLGGKISGKAFTQEELKILDEVQKQLSLALWSLELDKAIQTTEQLTRLKSKFLANVTHELRTPLNAIINYIGFVIDDDHDELNREQIDYLDRALAGAETLLQIINNILDMSKIEVGQMTLHRQPADLANIVAETTPLVREMIINKPIKLVTDVSAALPNLYVDRLRLRQIILNILSNAAKFTEVGNISLRAYPDNGNVVIQVTDTGVGIDEQTLPTIFQHFTSSALTDARLHFGPGLSMPITKSLVELHGGQVDVESQPGQGTKFTVILPAS